MATQLELYILGQTGYLETVLPQQVGAQTLLAPTASVTYTVVTPFNRIWCQWRANSSNATTALNLEVRLNGASGSSYLWQDLQANNSTVTGTPSAGTATSMLLGTITGNSSTANYFSSGDFIIDGANQSASFMTAQGKSTNFVTSTNSFISQYGGQYNVLGALTSVTLLPSAGNFTTGSQFSFYGMN